MAPSSAAGKWQARRGGSRAGQDPRHVTGVTERVWGDGDFTPSLQTKNQIRAIAPPSEQPRPTPQGFPGPPTGRRPMGRVGVEREHARSSRGARVRARSTVDAPRGPPEANRARIHDPSPAVLVAPDGARTGTKKIALDPAESSAIDDETCWGRRPPCRALCRATGLGVRMCP